MTSNINDVNKAQSPVKGFSLYALSIFMLSVTDASAKWLTTGYPIGEIVFFRSIFSFLPLLFVAYKGRITLTYKSQNYKANILRAIVVVFTAVTFFISVKHLPLANATVLSLSNPFFMTLLGLLILKEKVSNLHWFFIFVGFLGVIISVGGLSSGSILYSFIGIISAFLYAIGGIVTRYLSRTDSAITIALYTTSFLLLFSIFTIDYNWRMPNSYDLVIFFVMGLTGGLCNYIATSALSSIDVAKVAPLEYTIIIWAAFFGFFFFNETPNLYTIIGSIMIIASGIAHIHSTKS
ncbi:DMT family transporter (plasmid) [Rahnella aquatilis]|uniref:DMT family transporter n=1 Tax=Rahnella perminowiae TaxID=2816244 RepID=A0ABS6KVS7_9GAMM|nr:DMT family transporter [Rahnella perminowiae]MBU9833723.1 DMT family transporter [Rahnella perminowiae]UJD92633.1 DMT family transporter [Rahnella aquatilis]